MTTHVDATFYNNLLPELTSLAAAYRAKMRAEDEALRRAAEEAERQQILAQCNAVIAEARDSLSFYFPDTLSRVLPHEAWAGYPSGQHFGRASREPIAVASLGSGVWLTYDESPYGGSQFHLVRACAECSRYFEVDITDDRQVALALENNPVNVRCDGCYTNRADVPF
ncbi:hypothetical protein [Streptomyces boninensis]|uniref:hypothetical protein n=1 Tax=Streptomyces boninensis TaxID=2039455 RepID=UPI003B21E788